MKKERVWIAALSLLIIAATVYHYMEVSRLKKELEDYKRCYAAADKCIESFLVERKYTVEAERAGKDIINAQSEMFSDSSIALNAIDAGMYTLAEMYLGRMSSHVFTIQDSYRVWSAYNDRLKDVREDVDRSLKAYTDAKKALDKYNKERKASNQKARKL